MGWGDEIMVTGEAVRLGCTVDKPLVVIGKKGRPIWHEMWDDNPRIWNPNVGGKLPHPRWTIRNHGGWRPYVWYAQDDYEPQGHNQTARADRTSKDRWIFHPDWSATIGELPGITRRPKGRYIVIEPNLKAGIDRTNKQWGWDRWQGLVDAMPGVEFVQLGPRGSRVLNGARLVKTASFIEACAHLSGAWAAALPEGGLHHAAAALGVPAVVLFGGSRSVRSTGYDCHINIDDPDPLTKACGSRRPCSHCDEYWRRLTPDIVAEALGELMVA